MKVLIWFLCFLSIAYADERYDYFQLVQQWPPTFCSLQPKGRQCEDPAYFTIHGLWPTNVSKIEKRPYCPGTEFSFSKIRGLKSDLDREWPNLKGNNIKFWRHEWDTHGKCSEDNFDQFKYFNITLAKKKEVDILKYLEEAGINPNGASYESSNISEAIKKKTLCIPRLWCKNLTLLEISVCFNKLAENKIDCPGSLLDYNESKCEGKVSFPAKRETIDEKDEL